MPTTNTPLKKAEYTKVNTGLGPITVESKDGVIHVTLSATQPPLSNTALHIVKSRDRIHFAAPDTDTWVLGTEDTDQIAVVTKEINTIEISARGGAGVAVFEQDQTTGVLDVPFLRQLSAPTLAIDTVVDGVNRDITLSPGHGLVSPTNNGEIIEIADSTNGSFFMQSQITTIVGDVVTLDSPVNRIYTTTESLVSHSSQDMNVDGSSTPVVFAVLPFSLQSGDMVRIVPEIRADAAMDFETFGHLPALTNGLVLRVNNGDGTYRNLYNFKSNGDIIKQCFDHDFFTNIGGGGRAFISRLTWGGKSKRGVVVRLDGALGESLEMVVQDKLDIAEGVTRHHWVANGSELQE